MNKVAVLHVGSGKTGSTTLQKVLYRNKNYNDEEIFYPTLLNHKTNQIFRFAFCKLDETTINIKKQFSGMPKAFLDYQEAIKADFIEQSKSYDSVLISSEFLFLSSLEEVNAIKRFLKENGFDKIHVIMYLRNPADYYLSVAQQALKNHPRIPTPHTFNYDIRGAIENWSSISENPMVLRCFDRKSLVEGDICKDFSFCISEFGYEITLRGSHGFNESLSSESIIFLEFLQTILYSKSERSNVELKEKINNLIKSNPAGTKPRLKKNVISDVHSRFEDTYKFLDKKFGFKLVRQPNFSVVRGNYEATLKFSDVIEDYDVNVLLKILKEF